MGKNGDGNVNQKWDLLREVNLGRKKCQGSKNEERIYEIQTSF